MNVDLRNYIWDFGNELPKGWLHYNYNYGGGGEEEGEKRKRNYDDDLFSSLQKLCLYN